MTNFSNPLGSCLPDLKKRRLVELLASRGTPLIEDDIYGSLAFEAGRPCVAKAFDLEGLVLWCGSMSKTLAPGYRIGWVAPGKFKEEVHRLRFSARQRYRNCVRLNCANLWSEKLERALVKLGGMVNRMAHR